MDAVSSGPAPAFFIRSRDAHTAGYDLTNEVPIVPVRQRVGSLHYWELSRRKIGGGGPHVQLSSTRSLARAPRDLSRDQCAAR